MQIDVLIRPARIFSRTEVLATPCPVPAAPWLLEHALLAALSVPFNIQGNGRPPHSARLRALRIPAE